MPATVKSLCSACLLQKRSIRKTFFKTMPLSYRRLLVSEHQFEPSQTGDGKVWFSAGLSQETCLSNYTVNAFPGSGRQVLILHFSINENQLFIGSHTVLSDTPAPCPNRIERKGGERRHERASCRGKYPRRQQSDGMHHQRKRRIYHRQSARRTTHAALLLHRLHPKNTPRTDKEKTSL